MFFIALRKDLGEQFLEQKDMFTVAPKLVLEFNEPPIAFKDIADNKDNNVKDNTKASTFWDLASFGQQFSELHPTGSFFNDNKSDPNKVLPTITADAGHGSWHYTIKRLINDLEAKRAGSYPLDYDFKGSKPKYIIGMSVPPVMTAQIATKIYEQWLSNLVVTE